MSPPRPATRQDERSQLRQRRAAPARGQLVAEGRRVGDGARVARDQVQPQPRPAHEGAGGQQVDRAPGRPGRSAACRPGPCRDRAAARRRPGLARHLPGRRRPTAAIGHQRRLGHRHAQREAGAAGRELQVAEAVRIRARQATLAAARGRSARAPATPGPGLRRPRRTRRRATAGAKAARAPARDQHPPDVGDIGLLAAERGGQGQWARGPARRTGRRRRRAGSRRRSRPPGRPGRPAPGRRRAAAPPDRPRLLAQVGVGQHFGEFAARANGC